MFPNIKQLYQTAPGMMGRQYPHPNQPAHVWCMDHNVAHSYDTVQILDTISCTDGSSVTLHQPGNEARVGGALLEADYLAIIDRTRLPSDEKEWWDLFRDASFSLQIGLVGIDHLDFVTYPLVMRMLTAGDRFPTHCVDPDDPQCIRFTFPLLFDCIVRDNVLPLPYNHDIVVSTNIKVPHRYGYRARYIAPEHNTIDFPRLNDMRGTDRLVYQLQCGANSKISVHPTMTQTLCCVLNLDHIMTGIHFAIVDAAGRVIPDSVELVRDIALIMNGRWYTFPSRQCFETCVQWQPPIDSEKRRELQLESDIQNTTPFPVEVWAIIFKYVANPAALITTCKFLRNTSYKKSIRRMVQHNGSVPRGWYSIPFASIPLERYVVQDATIHISRIVEVELRVFFRYGIPDGELGIYVCGIGMNVMRHMHAWVGLAFSH